MAHSSNRRLRGKVGKFQKPRPDFPLTPHNGSDYWCKKVRGRLVYFGKLADDPKGEAPLDLWNEQKDDLLAGREPKANRDELTVLDLCNEFTAHKEALRDNGEISVRTYRGNYDTCATIIEVFGRGRAVSDLAPADFAKLRGKLAKTRQAVALRNEMQRVRSVFKFAFDQGLIVAPIRFGQSFAKPKLDVVRRDREAHRQAHGNRMFEASEIRLILDYLAGDEITLLHVDEETGKPVKVKGKHSPALRAMVLLAANGALGQSD